MSADRRVVAVFACVLTMLMALGATRGSTSTTDPALDGSSVLRTSRTTSKSTLAPALPTDLLRPLVRIDTVKRFPRLAPALTQRYSLPPDGQILSYYGNPHVAQMGVLGAAEPEAVADLLAMHAAYYDHLNGPLDVTPALHLVYAVAQPHRTANGLSLQYVDDALVRGYIDLVERRDMLLFLDIQVGHSTVAAEVEKALPYLDHPRVHLAIDPEFAMEADDDVPGIHLGSVDADDINRAQEILQWLVRSRGLPPKLFMVHQFADSMVRDTESIGRYPGVELVIDLDGVGPAAAKRLRYERYAARPYVHHPGIKLFTDHDPDLMSEEEILRLEPRPAVIIYQ